MTEEINIAISNPLPFVVVLLVIIALVAILLTIGDMSMQEKTKICGEASKSDKFKIAKVEGIEKCCFSVNNKVRCLEWKEFYPQEESLLNVEVEAIGTFLNLTT